MKTYTFKIKIVFFMKNTINEYNVIKAESEDAAKEYIHGYIQSIFNEEVKEISYRII